MSVEAWKVVLAIITALLALGTFLVTIYNARKQREQVQSLELFKVQFGHKQKRYDLLKAAWEKMIGAENFNLKGEDFSIINNRDDEIARWEAFTGPASKNASNAVQAYRSVKFAMDSKFQSRCEVASSKLETDVLRPVMQSLENALSEGIAIEGFRTVAIQIYNTSRSVTEELQTAMMEQLLELAKEMDNPTVPTHAN